MGFFKSLSSVLTTLAGVGVAVGAAMTAGGVDGGAAITAASTAFGLAMAKDGHKEG